MKSKDLPSVNLEINKETYLNRLDQVDRENLLRLAGLFSAGMQRRGVKGALVAIGGTLTKVLPRKDIDTVLVFERTPVSRASEYEVALSDLHVIENLCQDLTSSSDFKITQTIEPVIDEEFGSPNLLRHDGSVTLKPPKGLPIEVIRTREQNLDSFIRHQKTPYSVVQAT